METAKVRPIAEIADRADSLSLTGPNLPNLGFQYTPTQLSIVRLPDAPVTVSLDTMHLKLQSVSKADAVEIHEHLWSDQRVMEKFATGVTRDLEYVEGRITAWEKRAAGGDPCGALTVRDKSGAFIGLVIVGHGDDPGTSEMAYLIRHDKWRQGFGSEAVKAATDHLFPALHIEGQKIDGVVLHSVFATARPDNPGSVRILEKAGFEEVSRLEKHGALRINFVKHLSRPIPES